MAIGTTQGTRFGEVWQALDAMVATDGSQGVVHPSLLLTHGRQMRDLSDAAHCLCMLHGRHPGVVEQAHSRSLDGASARWFADAVGAFADERASLVRIVASVGPLPSTPGQAESEAAIAAQRHALDMLARSDRNGCPLGAALAVILDWPSIRQVLDRVAERAGIALPPSRLPGEAVTAAIVAAVTDNPGVERAMLFGAQQTLAQHRALWLLLEARAGARDRAY